MMPASSPVIQFNAPSASIQTCGALACKNVELKIAPDGSASLTAPEDKVPPVVLVPKLSNDPEDCHYVGKDGREHWCVPVRLDPPLHAVCPRAAPGQPPIQCLVPPTRPGPWRTYTFTWSIDGPTPSPCGMFFYYGPDGLENWQQDRCEPEPMNFNGARPEGAK